MRVGSGDVARDVGRDRVGRDDVDPARRRSRCRTRSRRRASTQTQMRIIPIRYHDDMPAAATATRWTDHVSSVLVRARPPRGWRACRGGRGARPARRLRRRRRARRARSAAEASAIGVASVYRALGAARRAGRAAACPGGRRVSPVRARGAGRRPSSPSRLRRLRRHRPVRGRGARARDRAAQPPDRVRRPGTRRDAARHMPGLPALVAPSGRMPPPMETRAADRADRGGARRRRGGGRPALRRRRRRRLDESDRRRTTQPTQPQEPTGTVPAPEPKPEPEVQTIVIENGKPQGGVQEIAVDKGDTVRFEVEVRRAARDPPARLRPRRRTSRPAARSRFKFKADIEGIFEIEIEDLGQTPIAKPDRTSPDA